MDTLGTLGYEKRSEIPWTKDRVAAEIYGIVGAIACGDVDELNKLARIYGVELAQQEVHPSLPPDPWTDKAVMYGTILALGEIVNMGVRAAIPFDVVGKVIASPEALDIFLRLADKPGGRIRQLDQSPDLARELLKDLSLIYEWTNGQEEPSMLELSRLGWAVANMLHRLGMNAS